MATVLRPPRPADFDAIAALTNTFIRDTAVHFGSADVAATELLAQWRTAVGGVRYAWLVAERDGAFAGYAKAGPWRSRAAYAWTTETTIYLPPAVRGLGLGRELYGRLLEQLAAQGFRSAIGGITLPNPASVRLHEALGFEACGVVRDAGCKFGRWHDVGFWQRRLCTDGQPGRPLQPPPA
jgi:phosphinothricin acetyltransferase